MRHNVFTAARDAVRPPDERVFTMNVLTYARAACLGLLYFVFPCYAALFVLLLLRHPVDVALALFLPLLSALGSVFLCHAVLAVSVAWFYPVRVGDNGVSATDFYGRKMTLSWGEIETVTPTRFLGVPYLKVASFRKDRAVLWLPLFVTRPDALRDAIRQSASPNNPLRRFVEGWDMPAPRREPLAQ